MTDTPTPDLSSAALEALTAEVIRLRADNERLSQRVTILWEENNAARAALDTP